MSKMNYELLKRIADNEKTITIAKIADVVEDIFDKDKNSYDEDDKIMYYEQAVDLANLFVISDFSLIGSDKEYHNLSVDYAKEGYYDSACKILNKGIEMNPYSVDLLADFLNYGMNYNKFQTQCDYYYRRLINISYNEWTWRAYSFAIDYLLNKRKQNIDNSKGLKEIALDLADKFISYTTEEYKDQAYVDKSSVYNAYGDRNAEVLTLNEGINQTKRSSKCRLRLADIEFQRGNYEKAVSLLESCWRELSVQPKINKSYTFLLLALGKASMFLENANNNLRSLDNDAISELKNIYKDFNSVLTLESEDIYKSTAKSIIKTFEIQTGVINTEKDEFINESIFDF